MFEHIRIRGRISLALAALLSIALVSIAQAQNPSKSETPREINIPAGLLANALDKLADQAGVQIMYEAKLTDGVRVQAVNGTLTFQAALAQLLANTGLRADAVHEKMVVLKRADSSTSNENPADQMRVAEVSGGKEANGAGSSGKEDKESDEGRLVTVRDKKIKPDFAANADIPRTINDVQPYYIFDEKTIRESGSSSVTEFMKNRLTMNGASETSEQIGPGGSSIGTNIALRGLNSDETLILVNGRRMANAHLNEFDQNVQPDLSAIPLNAIERIEVLPSSASGIYGGNALGGVINVILKRDYSGAQLNVVYNNTIDTDAPIRTLNFSWGTGLENGKTQVMLSGGYSDTSSMVVQDREFFSKYLDTVLERDPAKIFRTSGFNATPFLGSTPNIISRNGSNLILKNGAVPLNSPITYVPKGYPGIASDGGALLAANAGRYNLEIPDVNQGKYGQKYPLGRTPVVRSLMANIRRQMTSHVELFSELYKSTSELSGYASAVQPRAGMNPLILFPTDPDNPFTTIVNVVAPSDSETPYSYQLEEQRYVVGLNVLLPHEWQGSGEYSWASTDYKRSDFGIGAAFSAALRSTQLGILSDPHVHSVNWAALNDRAIQGNPTQMQNVAFRAAGPMWFWSLPKSAHPALSMAAERRSELLKEGYIKVIDPSGSLASYRISPSKSQVVTSASIEMTIPLAPIEGLSFLKQFELQLSERRDRYQPEAVNPMGYYVVTPNGETVDPPIVTRTQSKYTSSSEVVGFRWQPSQDVTVRAAYSTGFRPPSFEQLMPDLDPPSTGVIFDPARNDERTDNVIMLSGGNPDLLPEYAHTIGVGVICTPRFVKGLRASVDYTHIAKSNAVLALSSDQILQDESHLSRLVTRDIPVPGDLFGIGRVTQIDTRYINVAEMENEAVDVSLRYDLQTEGWGSFDIWALASWQLHYLLQYSYDLPPIEQVNGSAPEVRGAFLLPFKGTGGVSWMANRWTLGWSGRYTPSYYIAPLFASAQGGSTVPSQMYHDIFWAYRVDEHAARNWRDALFSNMDVQLSISNVFDKDPPLDAQQQIGYLYSHFGDPRGRNYTINVTKSF